MTKMELRLGGDRRAVTLTVGGVFEITLDALAVEGLVRALGLKRAQMAPPVSQVYNFADDVSIEGPRWSVTAGTSPGVFFMLRDPRYGWIRCSFSREQLEELVVGLKQVEGAASSVDERNSNEKGARKNARTRRSH